MYRIAEALCVGVQRTVKLTGFPEVAAGRLQRRDTADELWAKTIMLSGGGGAAAIWSLVAV